MNIAKTLKLLVAACSCSMLLGCASGEKLKFPAWFGTAKSDAEIDQGGQDQALAGIASPTDESPANAMQLASADEYVPTAGLLTLQKGQDLQQILAAATGPVVLDFYADWCDPCRKQGKILHQLEPIAAQNGATIIKINVDEHPRIKRDFQVTALPTLVVVKNGQIATRKKGLANETQLVSWLSN